MLSLIAFFSEPLFRIRSGLKGRFMARVIPFARKKSAMSSGKLAETSIGPSPNP